MTINTKYNIGKDFPWFMRANSPVQMDIKKIYVKTDGTSIAIEYEGTWLNTQWGCIVNEHNLYPTKQALLESL